MTFFNGCIWITRTSPHNQTMSLNLRSNGWNTIVYSLQKIIDLPFDSSQFLFNNNRKVVIITSSHAVKALEHINFNKEKTLVGCVGRETAARVFKAGFQNIIVPEVENGENLFKALLPYCNQSDLIIHLSGLTTRFDFIDMFKNLGFVAQRKLVYKAIGKNNIPSYIVKKVNNKKITHVSFCSIGAVKVFFKLFIQYNLNIDNMIAVCLSAEIAEQCCIESQIGTFKEVL